MAKTLDDALNEGVRATLGALQFQVISLAAERDVLAARVAELEAAKAAEGVV